MTSPSSWGRETECLASTVLPPSRSTGPMAARGTSIHRFMCQRAQATTDEERADALEEMEERWRPVVEALDWSRLPQLDPASGVPELALAWSPTTGMVRELGRNGDVEHDDVKELLRGDEIGGIADWVSLVGNDAVFVCDWKSGWAVLERAEVNHQLRAYGLWVARLFSRERAIVSYARLFDNGNVSWDVATMDELKLDAAEAALRQHLKRVAEAQLAHRNTGVIPMPNEGGHCTYCPAYRFCPAKVSLLLSAIEQDPGKGAQLAQLPEPLNHDVVSRLWPRLKAAEKLIERLQKDMRDYVRLFGAVKLPNGNLLAETESQTTSIDPIFARPTIEARFGPEGANMAIKSKETLTWSSLDDLLKCHSSHGKMAKLKREVVAELEEAGAVRSVMIHNVTEVSAKSKRLKAANEDHPQLPADTESKGAA